MLPLKLFINRDGYTYIYICIYISDYTIYIYTYGSAFSGHPSHPHNGNVTLAVVLVLSVVGVLVVEA